MKSTKTIQILFLLLIGICVFIYFDRKEEKQSSQQNIILTLDKLEIEIKKIKENIESYEIFVVQPTTTSEMIVYKNGTDQSKIIQSSDESEESYSKLVYYFVDESNYYIERFSSYENPAKNIYNELVYNEREEIYVIGNKIVKWLYVDNEVTNSALLENREHILSIEIENIFARTERMYTSTEFTLKSFQLDPIELDGGGCTVGFKDQAGHVFTSDFVVGYINVSGKLERLEQDSYSESVETYTGELYSLRIKLGDVIKQGYESTTRAVQIELEDKISGEKLEITNMEYFCGF